MASHRMISVSMGKVAFRCRAFLDDIDVSDKCVAADPIEGWVDCYHVGRDGKFTTDDLGYPKVERICGRVRIEAIEDMQDA